MQRSAEKCIPRNPLPDKYESEGSQTIINCIYFVFISGCISVCKCTSGRLSVPKQFFLEGEYSEAMPHLCQYSFWGILCTRVDTSRIVLLSCPVFPGKPRGAATSDLQNDIAPSPSSSRSSNKTKQGILKEKHCGLCGKMCAPHEFERVQAFIPKSAGLFQIIKQLGILFLLPIVADTLAPGVTFLCKCKVLSFLFETSVHTNLAPVQFEHRHQGQHQHQQGD